MKLYTKAACKKKEQKAKIKSDQIAVKIKHNFTKEIPCRIRETECGRKIQPPVWLPSEDRRQEISQPA